MRLDDESSNLYLILLTLFKYLIYTGRQGWLFDDTFKEGSEPVRMTLGTTDCIAGLEIGLAGDEGPMPPMKYVDTVSILYTFSGGSQCCYRSMKFTISLNDEKIS